MAPGNSGPCISTSYTVCAPECAPALLCCGATYFSSCDTSSILTQSDFVYFFGIKSPYLTASWSLKASPNILPAGMIYSKNAHFLYFFSQDSANLFLTIINNWSGSLTNEIHFGGIQNPNIFSEKLLEIDAQTAGSLVWVGDNPSSPSSPLIIHILLNNVTG